MNRTVYLETMGCQMNKLDSELVTDYLGRQGFSFTDDADQAGVIIFNTCSVRQHAEDKVISKIGQLGRRHRERSDLVLAVVGCMAERLGAQLLDQYRQVDVVCGPGQLHQLGEMVQQAQQDRQKCLALNESAGLDQWEELDNSRSRSNAASPFQAYLRIMRGCNKYCSYCVVPYVRGPELCRSLDNIVAEAQRLVASGVKEITLLGQTVNSYRYVNGEQKYDLADVLERIHEIDGLQRLRFVTSYPRDFNERILQAMHDLPKVCQYLHIPAQSGSDRILKAMNRRYTVRQYLDLIEMARKIVPTIAFSGDFIVGFHEEEEQDFAATRNLLRQVRYKNCFIFKYSPRPGTRADKHLADNVPDQIKRQRNTELLALQNEISKADNKSFLGETVEILVEGPSKKPHLDNNRAPQSDNGQNKCPTEATPHSQGMLQLVGRTKSDHIVVLPGTLDLVGRIINVKITKVSALTLFGQPSETTG